MRNFIIALLLLGGTLVATQNISFETDSSTIHIHEVKSIGFSITLPENGWTSAVISATSSNDGVVTVDAPPSIVHGIGHGDSWNSWNSSMNVTGVFLGSAYVDLSVTFDGINNGSSTLPLTVIREVRAIDTAFTTSVALLASILYINFGCAMDWDLCSRTMKRPIGPLIGFICQFGFMPLMSYGLGYLLFPDSAEMQLGMFFTGVSPSGGASNIWTVLLGGNLNLSITMTTICTLAAFGMMPLWLFTLGKKIFERGEITVPYSRIAMFAIGLVVPLAIGYAIQKKLPRVCRVLVRIMKPFSALLILFIVIFAIVTNLYLFQLFSWQIIVAGMGLPWLGYGFGGLISYIFRQPGPDIRAISIESGIQNTGISIFLLRFTLAQPAADLTTVVPVSCAIMTPLPLIILFIIKIIVDRRKSVLAGSHEKLQDATNRPTINASSDRTARSD